MKILKVALKLSKKHYPYVKILFTPIEVYSHHYGYEKLQKAIYKASRKFKSIIVGVDTIRGHRKEFKDRGMIFHFKINHDSKIKQAYTKLKKFKGKEFVDKRDV